MAHTAVLLDPAFWEGIDPATEALLDAWLVAPGDAVEAGQVLGRAVLVKSTLDITAPAAGRVDRLLVAAGASFARGATLALLQAPPA